MRDNKDKKIKRDALVVELVDTLVSKADIEKMYRFDSGQEYVDKKERRDKKEE